MCTGREAANECSVACCHILRGLKTWKQSRQLILLIRSRLQFCVGGRKREQYMANTPVYLQARIMCINAHSVQLFVLHRHSRLIRICTFCTILHYLYLFFQLTVYRASGSLHTVLKWGLECCGWRKRVREKWRAGKRLRSICPVRLLPLHNL